MITANKECPVCQNHHDNSLPLCPQEDSIAVVTKTSNHQTEVLSSENLANLKVTLKTCALNNDIKTLRQTYLKLAKHFYQTNQLDQSLSYFHKAELLESTDLSNTALKEIIEIYIKLDQLDKALRPIKQLAQLYARSEQRAEAKDYFENLISSCQFNLNWVREILAILDINRLTGQLNLNHNHLENSLLTNQIELYVSVATDDSDDEMPLINDLIEEENTFDPYSLSEIHSASNASLANTNLPVNGKASLASSKITEEDFFDQTVPSKSASEKSLLETPVFKESPVPIGNKFVTPKEMPKLITSTKTDVELKTHETQSNESRSTENSAFFKRNTGSFRPIEKAPSYSSLSVMIVDDDAAVRELLVELLADFGCRVIEAIDGEEAIEKLKDVHPSFIISDLVMPRKDGYALFEYLQSNDNLCDIPFIFLTGRMDKDDKLQALQGGVEDYWLKPFEVGEISIRLRRMLQKVQLAGDVRGKLSEIPLPDLLQSLASGNKSGLLRLSRSGRYGVIYMEQGRIIDAEFEDLAGKTAIYCLVNWCMDGGNFNFHSQLTERTVVIKQSIQGILMEAMRRRDEEFRLIEQLPPGDVFMSVNIEDNPEFFSADFSDETMRILQLFDGTHPLKECLHCLQGDLETIQTVIALNKAGLLRIVDFGID